jgi:hypothetical protein
MTQRHRRGAHFVMDVSRYCCPLDRNERAPIMFLVKQLEERTVPMLLTRTPTICCGCRTHTLSGRGGPNPVARAPQIAPESGRNDRAGRGSKTANHYVMEVPL